MEGSLLSGMLPLDILGGAEAFIGRDWTFLYHISRRPDQIDGIISPRVGTGGGQVEALIIYGSDVMVVG